MPSRLLPYVLPLFVAACATTPLAPELAPTGPVVEDLRIVGNEEVPDSRIRGAIATRETNRFLFFGAVHRLDPGAVAQDVRRIRDIYEEEGFYAAQVDAIVERTGEDEVAVEFVVEEGPPTVLRTLLVEGLDALDREAVAEVLADPPVVAGERFVEADWVEWKEAVLERLRERGFADARVDARVEVAPEQGAADAVLVAATGRRYRFGEVQVVGNQLVPEERIRNATVGVLDPGDRFSPEAMAEAQEEVFALGAFSVVTVSGRSDRPGAGQQVPIGEGGERAAIEDEPPVDPEEPEPGTTPVETPADERGPAVMPVVVAVSEADFLRIRLGAGVGLDQSFYQARALAEVTHLNLFGGLQQLQWSNQLAYRFINPASDLVGESGLAGRSEVSFTQPDFVSNRIDLAARIRYERQLTSAYTAQSVSGRIGTPIRFRRWLYFVPSYNITRFFDVSVFDEELVEPVGPGVRPSLVGDCPEGCLLSWLEQQLVADRRDDPLEPHRGWYGSLGVQEGGIGGDFAWLRFRPEVRGYVPLGDEFVLAGRLELGYLLPLGDCDETQALDPYLAAVGCSPIVVRLFGGGADHFRGSGVDRLSPLRAVEVDGRTRYIPLGGNSSLLATTELRWYFAESWSSAFFLDAGNVAAKADAAFALRDLQLAAGAGMRYRTPIGPARLDLGYRFLQEPTIPVGGGPPPERNTIDYFAIFLSIGEAF